MRWRAGLCIVALAVLAGGAATAQARYQDSDPPVVTADGGGATAENHLDHVHAISGPRALLGGRGDDSVYGTTGNDSLSGNAGRDSLYGRGGDDSLMGGPGADRLDGGTGDDVLDGGSGKDLLIGGTGDDSIQAQDGQADVIRCGPGLDVAIVDRGLDRVSGCEHVAKL